MQNLLLESRKCWISGEKNNTDMDKLHILQMEVTLRTIDSGVNRIFCLCIFTGIDVVFQWLVQAGKLCVILPEMKILEAYVRKLERWQDRAKIVVECTMSLQVSEL